MGDAKKRYPTYEARKAAAIENADRLERERKKRRTEEHKQWLSRQQVKYIEEEPKKVEELESEKHQAAIDEATKVNEPMLIRPPRPPRPALGRNSLLIAAALAAIAGTTENK